VHVEYIGDWEFGEWEEWVWVIEEKVCVGEDGKRRRRRSSKGWGGDGWRRG
jgi:hypothetical protein